MVAACVWHNNDRLNLRNSDLRQRSKPPFSCCSSCPICASQIDPRRENSRKKEAAKVHFLFFPFLPFSVRFRLLLCSTLFIFFIFSPSAKTVWAFFLSSLFVARAFHVKFILDLWGEKEKKSSNWTNETEHDSPRVTTFLVHYLSWDWGS